MPTPELNVFKFGGASLKDAAAIRNVANILQGYAGKQLVIIVSAMGKTTNALELVARAYFDGDVPTARQRLTELHNATLTTAKELFGQIPEDLVTSLNDLFVAVEWIFDEAPSDLYDYDYDQIVSLGELISSQVVAAWLNHEGLQTHWVDARDCILTDNTYREGWVQWPETQARIGQHVRPLLASGGFVLTQGFIGSTSENFTTTLGREGSDYSAAIFSYCLDAVAMTIWKDVPGVLTADPRLFENVTKVERLSYREAIEMTYYGASIIHPKTIKPLQNKSIPLFVRSFVDPTEKGTEISDEAGDNYPPMVAVEKFQALVNISTRDFSFVAEHHIKQLFEHITTTRLQVNMMQNTAISFNIVVNDIDDRVERFCQLVNAEFKTAVERDLELITVRHYTSEVADSMRRGKVQLLEGRMPLTLQMVVKEIPVIRRKD
ncbi:aspartate kinase [Neolewinella lacunae]|uniref:Aspartokinase n=1 Tax=Neolewinella lacunae TaxID=1517758 RepID=A0A923PM63_9BACT|nr:aspartate kinase [Neolewinella lacunae]MBC6996728.1 aspartate kinase [Neolewinella lacunae]MDN3633407.1 aspartate kinase [Neolewinella lacunae]